MKTLYDLLKDHSNLIEEVEVTDSKLRDLKSKIREVEQEVFDRFAPKHLLDLECVVKSTEWSSSITQEKGYDSITENNTFLVNYIGGGYRKEFAKRKCKIVGYSLIKIRNTGEIVWQISAVVANKDGEFGKLHIYSNIIDKTHLAD